VISRVLATSLKRQKLERTKDDQNLSGTNHKRRADVGTFKREDGKLPVVLLVMWRKMQGREVGLTASELRKEQIGTLTLIVTRAGR
jgi:hypothetical protein